MRPCSQAYITQDEETHIKKGYDLRVMRLRLQIDAIKYHLSSALTVQEGKVVNETHDLWWGGNESLMTPSDKHESDIGLLGLQSEIVDFTWRRLLVLSKFNEILTKLKKNTHKIKSNTHKALESCMMKEISEWVSKFYSEFRAQLIRWANEWNLDEIEGKSRSVCNATKFLILTAHGMAKIETAKPKIERCNRLPARASL